MKANDRPKAAAALAAFDDSTTSHAGVLLAVEIDLKSAGRRLEWVSVQTPAFGREAEIIFMVARRIRSERLRAA
jgi:hypothetical protein